MPALVVDDAKMMRTIVRRTLESLGINDIIEAEDGVEAITAFKKKTFDIVLTDWNMPNKNGLEVVQEIRAIDKKVPVFMVTTQGQQNQVLEAIKAGVTDYVLKPFDAETLKAKLEKHLTASV